MSAIINVVGARDAHEVEFRRLLRVERSWAWQSHAMLALCAVGAAVVPLVSAWFILAVVPLTFWYAVASTRRMNALQERWISWGKYLGVVEAQGQLHAWLAEQHDDDTPTPTTARSA